MIIQGGWMRFVLHLERVSYSAAEAFLDFVDSRGGIKNIERQELLDYAYAIVTKYGEGSAALAAQWYDELAAASNVIVPPAEPAPTASYADVARTVNGVINQSANEDTLAGAVQRLVKTPGADTTLINARRDGAEVAWIPNGDTCAFCIALASRGWQSAGKVTMRGGHAEHIHGNCDCTYAVRFDDSTSVAGYDPSVYEDMYYSAEGSTPKQRINSMRRAAYAENSAEINAQKRAAYAKRVERNSSAAEEIKT